MQRNTGTFQQKQWDMKTYQSLPSPTGFTIPPNKVTQVCSNQLWTLPSGTLVIACHAPFPYTALTAHWPQGLIQDLLSLAFSLICHAALAGVWRWRPDEIRKMLFIPDSQGWKGQWFQLIFITRSSTVNRQGKSSSSSDHLQQICTTSPTSKKRTGKPYWTSWKRTPLHS